uniref:Metal-binding protein n=1 Tax=Archaeoglobus fulgidus TaxID=2234 RepID=A0A7C2S8S1_ARCFL
MSGQFGKEELVHLHLLLFHVKKTFESYGLENEYFSEYNSLNISPVQIFRRKNEHQEAIFKLCMGIMKAMGKEKEAEELCKSLKRLAMVRAMY